MQKASHCPFAPRGADGASRLACSDALQITASPLWMSEAGARERSGTPSEAPCHSGRARTPKSGHTHASEAVAHHCRVSLLNSPLEAGLQLQWAMRQGLWSQNRYLLSTRQNDCDCPLHHYGAIWKAPFYRFLVGAPIPVPSLLHKTLSPPSLRDPIQPQTTSQRLQPLFGFLVLREEPRRRYR